MSWSLRQSRGGSNQDALVFLEHFGIAFRFGLTMLSGGFACLVHALFPKLFERTGSAAVKRLYSEMLARQPGQARAAYQEPSWRPEYEI